MEIRWLPFASEQLKVVLEYVIDHFGEMTARKSLRRVLDGVDVLRMYPAKGIYDKQFSKNGIAVRHLNVGPNMVYYLVDRNEVVVIAIVHCKQSPTTIHRAIKFALNQCTAE